MSNIPTKEDGIVWVTGASSGIGREVAAQLARAGWVVAISARRRPELESLAAEHPGMIVAPVDITDGQAVLDCVAAIEAQAGRPVVRAILNAGTYLRDTAPKFDVARFTAQINVNLVGTAHCLAALLPRMIAARRGQIGVVSSLAGLSGLPAAVTYSTTKAGLIAMCEALKFDLDRAGVGISVILPGFVKTPLTDKNDFPMPLLMEVGDAAQALLAGLDKGRFIVAFPGGLAWPPRPPNGEWSVLGKILFRVPKMPKPLMSGDQAFNAFAAVGIRRDGPAGQHCFKNVEKLLADFIVALVARMMKGDEYFIRQAAAIARGIGTWFGTLDVVLDLGLAHHSIYASCQKS
jgi:short-subunit dehydrogenase